MNDWLIETLQLMDFAPPLPPKKKLKREMEVPTFLTDEVFLSPTVHICPVSAVLRLLGDDHTVFGGQIVGL